jgi:hypothetical protein
MLFGYKKDKGFHSQLFICNEYASMEKMGQQCDVFELQRVEVTPRKHGAMVRPRYCPQ